MSIQSNITEMIYIINSCLKAKLSQKLFSTSIFLFRLLSQMSGKTLLQLMLDIQQELKQHKSLLFGLKNQT